MVGYVYLSSNRLTAVLTNVDGEPLDGATVQITLKDAAGTAINFNPPTIVWPVTMTPVGGGSGRYTYTPDPLLPLQNDVDYFAWISATVGGLKRFAKVRVHVQMDSD